jgi:hypothetical protein
LDEIFHISIQSPDGPALWRSIEANCFQKSRNFENKSCFVEKSTDKLPKQWYTKDKKTEIIPKGKNKGGYRDV